MSAGLVLETILVVNLALGREKGWKMLEDDCLWIKKKKIPDPQRIESSENSRSFLMTVVLFHRAVPYTVENRTISGPDLLR